MYKIELDVVDAKDAAFLVYLSVMGIEMNEIDADGPAGGNAFCEFVGGKAALEDMIDKWFGGDRSLKHEIERK